MLNIARNYTAAFNLFLVVDEHTRFTFDGTRGGGRWYSHVEVNVRGAERRRYAISLLTLVGN